MRSVIMRSSTQEAIKLNTNEFYEKKSIKLNEDEQIIFPDFPSCRATERTVLLGY